MAGWQFNSGGTEEVFWEKGVALENAFAGSGSGCLQRITICNGHYTVYSCTKNFTNTRCGQYEIGCLNCSWWNVGIWFC